MIRSAIALFFAAALCLSPASPPAAVAFQEPAEADTARAEDDEGLPLEPARTLEMTLSEGTWLSLDVSPDGETVVFELLGNLYTVPIAGGEALPLTQGMAFDMQPRYSPEGERIAFVSDRSGSENVWTISADGGDPRQITEGDAHSYQSPEWTPNGEYIVVSRSEGVFGGPEKLWLFPVEGGSGISIVEDEDFPDDVRMLGAAFGDDARYIWYAQREDVWEYNADLPQYQIAIYDRKTGQRYTRTYRYGSAFRPTLSPNGEWLVYGTRWDAQTGLRIRNLETGEERWLAYPVTHDAQEAVASRGVYPGMAFTPDSRAVVASYGGELWRIPVDGSASSRIRFSADVELAVGPKLDFEYSIADGPAFTAEQIRAATPSPDGAMLAFTALDQLYVMEYPNGEPQRLTNTDNVTEAQPTWSPGGEWIAYATWSTRGEREGGHIYRIRADGSGEPQRLTRDPALYQQPAWGPEGERIVAIRGPGRVYEQKAGPFTPGAAQDLVWIPADGGETRFITPVQGRRNPHFIKSEPNRIYLYSQEKGLLSIRWDGTDQQQILKVRGRTLPGNEEPRDPSLVLMAPDGDHAVARLGWQLYLIDPPPFAGAEPPVISVGNPEQAAVPVHRITDIGGEFPAWGSEGGKIHWSLGNAHFVYDLSRAEAVRDSVRAAEEPAEELPGEPAEEEGEDVEGADEDELPYEPAVTRIRIEVAYDFPNGTLALTGARVIPMTEESLTEAAVIENGTVIIEDNRIAAVGPASEVEIPEGADVMDVSGATILPGFVDTHAHIWPAWGIHKTQVPGYLANLAYGVTTTRDPQTSTTDVLTYADKVRAGMMLGPRIFSTGPGIFRATTIESLEDAREVLRKYSRYFNTKTIKMYLAGNREQRQWIIMAAKEQRLLATTEGALDMKLDLTQIIDGYPGHEHSFPIFPLYEDVSRLVAMTGVTYTPTLLVSYGGPWAENYFYTRMNPHDSEKLQRFTPHQALDQKTRRRTQWFVAEDHVFPNHARQLAQMVELGANAGVGSHGQLQGLGYHWELWALASGGLSNYQALRIATIVGAEGIGLEREIGSLEPGKLADLLVLTESPLVDLQNTTSIRYVMKGGRLYKADKLDQVWPRQVELGELYWQGQAPADVSAGIESPAPSPTPLP